MFSVRIFARVDFLGSWSAAAFSWLLGGDRGTGECVFLVYPPTQRQAVQPPLGAEPGAVSRQSTEACRRISSFLELQRAWFALGKLVHHLLLVSYLAVKLPVSGC